MGNKGGEPKKDVLSVKYEDFMNVNKKLGRKILDKKINGENGTRDEIQGKNRPEKEQKKTFGIVLGRAGLFQPMKGDIFCHQSHLVVEGEGVIKTGDKKKEPEMINRGC